MLAMLALAGSSSLPRLLLSAPVVGASVGLVAAMRKVHRRMVPPPPRVRRVHKQPPRFRRAITSCTTNPPTHVIPALWALFDVPPPLVRRVHRHPPRFRLATITSTTTSTRTTLPPAHLIPALCALAASLGPPKVHYPSYFALRLGLVKPACPAAAAAYGVTRAIATAESAQTEAEIEAFQAKIAHARWADFMAQLCPRIAATVRAEDRAKAATKGPVPLQEHYPPEWAPAAKVSFVFASEEGRQRARTKWRGFVSFFGYFFTIIWQVARRRVGRAVVVTKGKVEEEVGKTRKRKAGGRLALLL